MSKHTYTGILKSERIEKKTSQIFLTYLRTSQTYLANQATYMTELEEQIQRLKAYKIKSRKLIGDDGKDIDKTLETLSCKLFLEQQKYEMIFAMAQEINDDLRVMTTEIKAKIKEFSKMLD